METESQRHSHWKIDHQKKTLEVREGGIFQKKCQSQVQEEDSDLNFGNFECKGLCDI